LGKTSSQTRGRKLQKTERAPAEIVLVLGLKNL
jgi:hypothetical protein